MTNNINREYLFVLPVPLMSPSQNARLGGIALLKTDDTFNIKSREFISCICPSHVLPSAFYLYSQHFLVNKNKDGLKERDFFNRVQSYFTENTTVITFSAKYLQILKSIALRNFKDVDVFKDVTIFDLKAALQACNLFGNTKTKEKDNLMKKACELNFRAHDLDSFDSKIDALFYLFKYLLNTDTKLINYLLQGKDALYSLIDKSIEERAPLFSLISSDHSYFILRAIKREKNLVYAFKLNLDNELESIVLDLDEANLIAPISILTPDRCHNLKLDKDFIVKSLYTNLDLEFIEDDFKKPFYSDYLDNLDRNSINFIYKVSKTKDNNLILLSTKGLSQSLLQKFLIYRAENIPSSLHEEEREVYVQYCFNIMQRDVVRYMLECKQIINNLDENDTKSLNLMQKISTYPQTL